MYQVLLDDIGRINNAEQSKTESKPDEPLASTDNESRMAAVIQRSFRLFLWKKFMRNLSIGRRCASFKSHKFQGLSHEKHSLLFMLLLIKIITEIENVTMKRNNATTQSLCDQTLMTPLILILVHRHRHGVAMTLN